MVISNFRFSKLMFLTPVMLALNTGVLAMYDYSMTKDISTKTSTKTSVIKSD